MFIVRRNLAGVALLAALWFVGAAPAEAQVRIPRVQSCTKTIGTGGTESWGGLHTCLGLEVEGFTSYVCIPRPPISCQPVYEHRMRARLKRPAPGTYLTASVYTPGASQCTFKVTSSVWTPWITCKGEGTHMPTPPTLRMDGSWLVY